MSNKRILMIAGPNGAGKTTFAGNFLLHEANCPAFVNADAIAAGLSPFQPHTMAIKAGKLMMSQIQEYVAKGVSFAFETTLSGRGYARMIPEWQSTGFNVKLIFLWLPDVEMAILRVKRRVRDGGHWIDDDTIHRRYHAGFANFEKLYKPLVDWWALYDSSQQAPIMIEKGGSS